MKASLVLMLAIATIAATNSMKKSDGAEASRATAKPIVAMFPSDLKWKAFDEKAGIEKGGGYAVLWGDPRSGPNGLMVRLPAGNAGAPHSHTNTNIGVTVMGGPSHQQSGSDVAKPLPPGSFWSQPGGTAHRTSCPGNEECVMLLQFNDGKFDFAAATVDPKAERPKDYVEKRPADLKFVPLIPDRKDSPQTATLWGDERSGPHGSFFKFPSGFASAPHTDTADYHAVVIQGTILNYTPDEVAPMELGPGSYFLQPARGVHITACMTGSDCLMYAYVMGKSDFQTVGPAKE